MTVVRKVESWKRFGWTRVT